jgi:hypothetical protein
MIHVHAHTWVIQYVLIEWAGWLTIISNNYDGGLSSMEFRCHNCATKMDFYSARHFFVDECHFINFIKKITLEILLHLKQYCLFVFS